jgi:hypothetical protein
MHSEAHPHALTLQKGLFGDHFLAQLTRILEETDLSPEPPQRLHDRSRRIHPNSEENEAQPQLEPKLPAGVP